MKFFIWDLSASCLRRTMQSWAQVSRVLEVPGFMSGKGRYELQV